MTGHETHPLESLWWLGQKFGRVQVQLYCYTRIAKASKGDSFDINLAVESYGHSHEEIWGASLDNAREELGLFDVSWLGLIHHIRQLRRDTKKEIAIHPGILLQDQKRWIPFLDGNGNWIKDLTVGTRKAAQFLTNLKTIFPGKTIAIYSSGTSFHIYPENVVMDNHEYSQFELDMSMEPSGYLDNKWFGVPTNQRGLRWSIGEENRPEPRLIRRITL